MMRAGIWYHMNQFYNDRDLSVSYTWVSTASVLAQARCLPLSCCIAHCPCETEMTFTSVLVCLSIPDTSKTSLEHDRWQERRSPQCCCR